MNRSEQDGAQKKREFAEEVLDNDLFPHCKEPEEKKYFLGYMTCCLLKTKLGIQEQSDRDSYLNKRIDLAGTLLFSGTISTNWLRICKNKLFVR